MDALNLEKADAGTRKISDISPILHLGYFPLKSILEKMQIKKYVDYFKLTNDFTYDLFELLSSLIYARAVNPCSKYRTFHEVLPNLYEPISYSYDQLLDGLSFLGNDYEKFVELFTVQTKHVFGIDTSKNYFDCTNFYFEIDREDDFRRKGPSKENRKEPIVGLGLLLDSHQIPVGMKMFPGNESEKPVLRDVIDLLKSQNNIQGSENQYRRAALILYPGEIFVSAFIRQINIQNNQIRNLFLKTVLCLLHFPVLKKLCPRLGKRQPDSIA